jgi:hypothetical protein
MLSTMHAVGYSIHPVQGSDLPVPDAGAGGAGTYVPVSMLSGAPSARVEESARDAEAEDDEEALAMAIALSLQSDT